MSYLDYARLESFDVRAFQVTRPYPVLNPEGLLTEYGYHRLLATLPPVEMMHPSFGKKRRHGQSPHDRWILEYRSRLAVSGAWHDFIAELQGARYRRWLGTMLGRRVFRLGFHWHYAPTGASVSPHCDSARKLASHIFYMNDSDWDPAWGGQTVVLDDGGMLSSRSAPAWEQFKSAMATVAVGNRSLLMTRRGDSWHGVRPLECPEGRMRKVFIVVVNDVFLSIPYLIQQRVLHRSSKY